MNKKFSTLVAGILLAGSLPVAAQYCPMNGEVDYRTRLVKAATLDKTFKDVKSINENYYYQLQVNVGSTENPSGNPEMVLSVERDYSTGKLYLVALPITEATLTHTLWQIKTPGREVNGRLFSYVNKETGYELTFDHNNAIQYSATAGDAKANSFTNPEKSPNNYNWNYENRGLMDGCNNWWSWYTVEDQTKSALDFKRVYSYFHNADSVMYLKAVPSTSTWQERVYDSVDDVAWPHREVGRDLTDALTSNRNGLDGTKEHGYAVVPIKMSAADAETWVQTREDILEIKPVVAGAKVLNAAEINSMIDADNSFLQFGANRSGSIANYDAWDDATNVSDRAGKTTKFTVCKPGSKELLSLASNPFNYTFRAIEAVDDGVSLGQRATGDYGGYNILFETEKPILEAGNDKQYGYLYVSEYPYEGQAFQGIYNGLEVKVAPFSYLKGNAHPYSKIVELRYPNATQLEAWHQSNNDSDQALYDEHFHGASDALQSRYFWKVTYYATNDSVVFEPFNASRMSQADATAGKKYEESNLASLQYSNFLNTVNAGIAYAAGVTGNTMFNKAPGVPVALYAMNFGPSVGDVSSFLTVGYASGVAADGSAVEASDPNYKAVKKSAANPAFVTNNEGYEYHSAMELTMRFAHDYTPLKRATVKDGVYFINVANEVNGTTLTENRVKGAYIVKDMKGHLVYDVAQDEQDFTHMPATQWVVEQNPCTVEGGINVNKTPVVVIRNREFDEADERPSFEGQLYADKDGNLFTINHREYKRDFNGGQTVDSHRRSILSCNDLLNFTKLEEVNTLGYFTADEDVLRENVYQFQNMYDFGRYRFLGIDDLKAEMDTLKLLENGGTEFELFTVKAWYPYKEYTQKIENGEVKDVWTGTWGFSYTDTVEYGYESKKAGAPQLYYQGFKLKLKDTNLIDNDHRFVAINNQHKYVIAKESEINDPANHLHFAVIGLKENNHMEGEHCYALLNAEVYDLVGNYTAEELQGLKRAWEMTDYGYHVWCYYKDADGDGERDANEPIRVMESVNTREVSGKLVVEGTTLDAKIADLCETTSSVFALVQANRPLYTTLDASYVNNLNKALTLRTIDEQGNEYLYEDSHSNKAQRWNMNYLGVENRTEEGNEGFYVDFVAASKGSRMPQYLFAVAADSVPAYRWCNELLPSGHPKHGVNYSCQHDEEYAGYTEGRFLVNYNDSIKKALIDKLTPNADKFKSDGYTRLGFKTAVHRGDYLYILNEGVELNDYKVASEDPAENGRLYIIPTFFSKDNEGEDKVWTAVKLDGTHNNVAFSLRNTGEKDEKGNDIVMIESNYDGESQIGSFSGAWIKIINNVPVLAKYYNNNGNHNTGDGTDSWKGENDRVSSNNNGEFINQGARFLFSSIDKNASATANEEVAAADVTVVAAQGAVIVKGAAGKVITVANVLGQTIANQVAASDNVTIAAPAGIVVVSVDGEATKVVVK